MIPTFVIFLREGVEASMIVAILLSYLDQIGQRRHFRDVFLGRGRRHGADAGRRRSTAYLVIDQYAGSTAQTVFETVTYLLAAAVLTYMTFWMQSHSRTMTPSCSAGPRRALEGRTRWGLGLLAFQAVGREGLETMVFTLAIVFASTQPGPDGGPGPRPPGRRRARPGRGPRPSPTPSSSSASGSTSGLFFRIIGIVLMVFAAGLLADAVENMQELGWLPFLDHALWNTSSYLCESSSIGDVFHSLLGYADQPTVLQAIVWVTYLGVATTAFVVMGAGAASAVPVGPPVPVDGDRGHRTGRPAARPGTGVDAASACRLHVAAPPRA